MLSFCNTMQCSTYYFFPFPLETLWFLVDIKLHFHVATFVFKATPTCCTNCISFYSICIPYQFEIKKKLSILFWLQLLCVVNIKVQFGFFLLLLLPSAQQKQEERRKHFMAHLCSFLFRFFLRVFVYVLITFMWLIYVEGSRHKMPAVFASRVCVFLCVCGWCVSWLTWPWAEWGLYDTIENGHRFEYFILCTYSSSLFFLCLISWLSTLSCGVRITYT